eukprot:COSAG01_NODE_38959_length_483_cov_0.674479_2_plen_58_part_01
MLRKLFYVLIFLFISLLGPCLLADEFADEFDMDMSEEAVSLPENLSIRSRFLTKWEAK